MGARHMDFDLPSEIIVKLAELDAFIEAEIKPLERENMQFFDHRREYARTDWENDGRPQPQWRARSSDVAGACRQGRSGGLGVESRTRPRTRSGKSAIRGGISRGLDQ